MLNTNIYQTAVKQVATLTKEPFKLRPSWTRKKCKSCKMFGPTCIVGRDPWKPACQYYAKRK